MSLGIDGFIISEITRLKEDAGLLQEVLGRRDKRRVVALRK